MSERNSYFDFLRGVAIIMVIGIHTYVPGYGIEIRQTLNVAVPMFLAISGFFLSRRTFDAKLDYVEFIKKRLSKIYIPTLLWQLPFFLYALAKSEDAWTCVITLLVCGFSIYYFVAAIIQCYVVLPVVNRCLLGHYKWGGVICSFIISITWIGFVTFLNVIRGVSIPMIVSLGPIPCWIMFFTLGVALGHCLERDYAIWPFILITILGLLLSCISSRYFYVHYQLGAGYKPSAFFILTGTHNGNVQF